MVLEEVGNLTPFAHMAFEKLGTAAQSYDVIVVKAACALRPGCGPDGIVPVDEPAPLHLADEHFGDPEQTSLRVAGDTLLFKPATDLYITGHARPPRAHADQWAAEIRLVRQGHLRKRRLRLLGERHWQWSMRRRWHLSPTQACESLPLRYELAFGGRHAKDGAWIEHADNPVGIGFVDAEGLDRNRPHPAPRIELFDQPSRAPGKPIGVPGLGPLPRFWQARSRHAGTYDETWQAQFDSAQVPGYPRDFDLRFFQGAHPDWVFEPWLAGDESIQLLGLTGDAPIAGRLPGWRIEALLISADGAATLAPLRLDTIEIDLDAARLYQTWRLAIAHAAGARQALLRVVPPGAR
jgi:hypothetical protein